MNRYFYDCEFIENGRTIDLISIGITCSDEREYYAINSDCDFSQASAWVQENVIAQLESNEQDGFSFWKTRSQIATEVEQFFLGTDERPTVDAYAGQKPDLWGYYPAYDHVVLCQLWGTMMNLPKGMPMQTNCIEQWRNQLGCPGLPEQGEGEHNALADARWNRQAWEFLRKYQEYYFTNRK